MPIMEGSVRQKMEELRKCLFEEERMGKIRTTLKLI